MKLIYLIGSHPDLAYLLARYAERDGYELRPQPALPPAVRGGDARPAALLFASIEDLEASQRQLAQWARPEVPVLVCTAINDEARARELGADQCLVHPLTHDGFLAALQAAHVAQ